MQKAAQQVSAVPSARPYSSLWRNAKRLAKNILAPIPGARKFLIASKQSLDHALYALNGGKAQPLFQERTQPGRPRAIIVSIPKSGTYLLHGFLEKLGLISARVHLGESGYYDQREEQEHRDYFGEKKIDAPLAATAARIGDGQLAASHLLYLPENVKTLRDFRVFFTYREERAAFVSFMRYFSNPGLGDEYGAAWKNEPDDKKRMQEFLHLYAPAFLQLHADIAGWLNEKRALAVKFETLCGDEGEAAQIALIQEIAGHVDIALSESEAKALASNVLGTGSRTWSGSRSTIEPYWSDAAERIFKENGGQRLNQRLGYP